MLEVLPHSIGISIPPLSDVHSHDQFLLNLPREECYTRTIRKNLWDGQRHRRSLHSELLIQREALPQIVMCFR
jgi:hypothetical protein